MRSRLRRFCSERCIAANADQKANCFYAAVCTLLSPQNFDSPFGLPQDDMLTLETLWLLVTLSEEGVICYDKPPQNDPRRVELTIVALAQLSGKKCLHFLRVWECLSIRPFSVLPVTNKQFFTPKKVHQTRLISLRGASTP